MGSGNMPPFCVAIFDSEEEEEENNKAFEKMLASGEITHFTSEEDKEDAERCLGRKIDLPIIPVNEEEVYAILRKCRERREAESAKG